MAVDTIAHMMCRQAATLRATRMSTGTSAILDLAVETGPERAALPQTLSPRAAKTRQRFNNKSLVTVSRRAYLVARLVSQHFRATQLTPFLSLLLGFESARNQAHTRL